DEYEFQQEKDSIQYANDSQRIFLEDSIKRKNHTQTFTFIALALSVGLIIALLLFFRNKQQANRLLKQKSEELQELNAVKDHVFSIIAHDLRSPINSLQSLLAVMQIEGALSPEESQMLLGRINSNVKGVSALLDNLLQWARLQMQGLQLSPQLVLLSLIIKQTTSLFSEPLKAKDITLETNFEEETMVFADPEIIRFLLRNLLSNAIKFSQQGGKVTLDVSMSDELVKVCVQDQGVGMDEARRTTLFQNFVTSEHGTNSEKGTGLGLMLCKELVTKSGGDIGVESTLGEGSTFWFTLPAKP
ncbi:MAG: HAMP domain-containing sensor histidine kinase, partial [Bacteroidota bacterium]